MDAHVAIIVDSLNYHGLKKKKREMTERSRLTSSRRNMACIICITDTRFHSRFLNIKHFTHHQATC